MWLCTEDLVIRVQNSIVEKRFFAIKNTVNSFLLFIKTTINMHYIAGYLTIAIK